MTRELIVISDESDSKGDYYSNFYGAVLIESQHLAECVRRVGEAKAAMNLHGEVKWSKITDTYQVKYLELMRVFFELVREGKAKIRIMFTHNIHIATGLTPRHKKSRYHILYYMFLRYAFGLGHSGDGTPTRLRLLMDQMPSTAEQTRKFKQYLLNMNGRSAFRAAWLSLAPDDICEVRSHDHDLLQCLDVVLGSMQFKLNDKDRVKDPVTGKRGKKTRAKDAVYKFINSQIRTIYTNFNIGITTGGFRTTNRWHHAYRHWCFVPSERRTDPSLAKSKRTS